MKSRRTFAWRGPPLALQIVALLVGGLIVAQAVTLFLTLLLPPAPAAQYSLEAIAAELSAAGAGGRTFERRTQQGPPDLSGPGWLVSERSRKDLANMVGVDEARVALAFYTPLPFAGAASTRSVAMADDGPVHPLAARIDGAPAGLFLRAQFVPPMGAGGMMMRGPMSGLPRPPAHGNFPPGMFPGAGPATSDAFGRTARGPLEAGALRRGGSGPLVSVEPHPHAAAGITIPGDGGVTVPALLRGGQAAGAPVTAAGATTPQAPSAAVATGRPPLGTGSARDGLGQAALGPGGALPRIEAGRELGVIVPRTALPGATMMAPLASDVAPRLAPPVLAAPVLPQSPAPAPAAAAPQPRVMVAPPAIRSEPLPPPLLTAPQFAPGPRAAAPAPVEGTPTGPPIPVQAPPRALFGLAPAPFVEGDFVAALHLPDGRWAVVQPAPEPFPNSWQRRVGLWFVLSLALVAPFGWLFARRLVKPLDRFARAAEQLGRDPAAAIGTLDGPAEIGRAAHAFNLMQNRLRSFVDDRTAMVGAISHDLRTPLTRMRFRIEDVPEEVRDGLLEEVDEMEAMIAQVIDFIRDASAPAARERLDLRTIVDEVVEDARMVGNDVRIEDAVAAPVEVDVLGMRRLLDNLLENAVKYGRSARIRVTTDAESAVAEIIDDGPGLPDDEIERVFEPFYRSESARASDKAGSGLGLAVCRSIARAHGGDVRLRRSADGFMAEMRVPLAYGADAALAG